MPNRKVVEGLIQILSSITNAGEKSHANFIDSLINTPKRASDAAIARVIGAKNQAGQLNAQSLTASEQALQPNTRIRKGRGTDIPRNPLEKAIGLSFITMKGNPKQKGFTKTQKTLLQTKSKNIAEQRNRDETLQNKFANTQADTNPVETRLTENGQSFQDPQLSGSEITKLANQKQPPLTEGQQRFLDEFIKRDPTIKQLPATQDRKALQEFQKNVISRRNPDNPTNIMQARKTRLEDLLKQLSSGKNADVLNTKANQTKLAQDVITADIADGIVGKLFGQDRNAAKNVEFATNNPTSNLSLRTLEAAFLTNKKQSTKIPEQLLVKRKQAKDAATASRRRPAPTAKVVIPNTVNSFNRLPSPSTEGVQTLLDEITSSLHPKIRTKQERARTTAQQKIAKLKFKRTGKRPASTPQQELLLQILRGIKDKTIPTNQMVLRSGESANPIGRTKDSLFLTPAEAKIIRDEINSTRN